MDQQYGLNANDYKSKQFSNIVDKIYMGLCKYLQITASIILETQKIYTEA
jgi:hypothetical protein